MSNTPSTSTSSDHDLIDFGARAALGLSFAFYAGACFNKSLAEFGTVDVSRFDAHGFSQALAVLAIGLYALTVACLYALRLRPIRRTPGAWPSAAALLGGFMMFGLLLLDRRTDLPLAAQLSASLLILTGNGFAIYILAHLGPLLFHPAGEPKVGDVGPVSDCAASALSRGSCHDARCLHPVSFALGAGPVCRTDLNADDPYPL